MFTMLSTTLMLLATTVAAQTGHEGHDHAPGEHGKGKWEWIGAFDLHEVAEGTGAMALTLSQKDGKWADKSCNVLVMRTTTADAAGIEASEAGAETLFTNASTFLHIESDDSTTIIVPEKVYHLEFDTSKKSHTYVINGITENSKHQANYVIYSQHTMGEFEGDVHYLKDSAGKDIEPKASEPEHKAHGNSASSVVVSAMAATVVMVATILL